jgi:hypothetical protein
MTYQDPVVRNPNDPWRREWGTGSVIVTIVAIVIMAGIIAYGTSTGTKMSTGPNRTALHHSTTGQGHAGS